MTTTIAVTNRKGGVGKTTTAVNVADALVRFHGLRGRVLLIDVDTQRNASLSCGTRPDDCLPSPAYQVLVSGRALADLAVPTPFGFDLLASHSDLDDAATKIRGAMASGGYHVLREAIAESAGRWDVIIVDTPPNVGDVTTTALVAADYALIPCPMSTLPYEGLVEVLALIERVRDEFDNPTLEVAGVFATMLDDNTTIGDVTRGLVEEAVGELLLPLRVRRNVALDEAQAKGVPVFVHKPDCNGAKDYRALTAQLVERGVMECFARG